jgi:hypothetical protein
MTTTTARQRTYEDVSVGDELTAVEFPLSMYRLVVAAGGNRDFNSIHHNRSYARASGAADIYASTFFLMGAWERVVRDYIGDRGTYLEGETGVVAIEVACRVGDEITVGPGRVTVTLPRASA